MSEAKGFKKYTFISRGIIRTQPDQYVVLYFGKSNITVYEHTA